jgi:hypothetical protein
MKEITDSNQKQDHNTVTLVNPKLFIREDWVKDPLLRVETLLEMLELLPKLIIIKLLLILRAN